MIDESFHLTSLDVRRFDFGKALRGYSPEKVEQFREQVAEEMERLGRINGEVNPTEFRISRPVNFSDLNLLHDSDYLELRARVRATAQDLCAQLDERVPELRGDRSADRDCVRDATRNAMRDVMENYHYHYG
mgnify:CR=1 FL=1